MPAAKKAKAHKVIAPLVQVRFGDRAEQYSAGNVLPEGVSEESINHLKSLGYVEEIDTLADGEN